jgi:carbon monoxide dehydrogenase subunit G
VKLEGGATLHADPERVWSVLTDPAVLARTIPGCESLERTGEDEYRMSVAAGVGAIKGTYAGAVRLTDQDRPKSYVMHASGSGAPGGVRATVTITLSPDGSPDDPVTQLTYAADATVTGAVAGVGQRMVGGVAKRMAAQFFTAVDAELTGTAAAAPAEGTRPTAAAVSATDVAGPAPAQAAQRQVFAGQAAAPAAGWVPAEARPLLVGAAGGGLLTLLGVWVGYLLGRRR